MFTNRKQLRCQVADHFRCSNGIAEGGRVLCNLHHGSLRSARALQNSLTTSTTEMRSMCGMQSSPCSVYNYLFIMLKWILGHESMYGFRSLSACMHVFECLHLHTMIVFLSPRFLQANEIGRKSKRGRNQRERERLAGDRESFMKTDRCLHWESGHKEKCRDRQSDRTSAISGKTQHKWYSNVKRETLCKWAVTTNGRADSDPPPVHCWYCKLNRKRKI